METSLHRSLKERYGPEAGGRLEVTLGAYRIDAVEADGGLVEVQSGPLAPLRPKVVRLLREEGTRLTVVKPVVLTRRIVRRTRSNGPDVSARLSPKRGALVDVFDDLVGLAPVFPRQGLAVDVLGVAVDEVRVDRRRGWGYKVVDRRLREVVGCVRLDSAADLWLLLPDACEVSDSFTTRDLADALDRPLHFAQRVAYCLRLTGAAEVVGKSGNHRVFRRAGSAGVGKGVTHAGA